MPLKIFDFVKVEDELKTHLEFIDFPGLNTGYEEALRTSQDLIRFTNGFFFIQGIIINENDNKKLLNTVIETIRNNNNNFSFKCCLFLMNKCDLNKIDINKSKLEFGNLVENILNRLGFIDRLDNDKDIKSLNEINFTKFSSTHFLRFLEDYKTIINIEDFFYELFNNEEYKKIDIKTLESIKNELKNKYFRINQKDIIEYNFDGKELSSCISFLSNYIKKKSLSLSPDIKTLLIDISKYYIYTKHHYNKLKFYVNSNAEHCFKTISDVFDNAKRFYKYELNTLISKCLINFGSDLNKIMKRIYNHSSQIDPSAFTQERRLYFLDKIDNISKEAESIVNENIQNQYDELNSSISRLRKNKNATRNDFTRIANEIAESNNKQLNFIKKYILNYLEKYKIKLEKIVKELLEFAKHNMNKYKKSNNSEHNLDEEDFQKNFKGQKNIVEELYEEPLLPILNCIPIVNIFTFSFTGIAAFIDWFRSHEEEYEKKIVEFEKEMKEKIGSFEYQVKSSIITMKNNTKNYISNIFDINSEDLDKLQKNKNLFNQISKIFENMLIEIINSN